MRPQEHFNKSKRGTRHLQAFIDGCGLIAKKNTLGPMAPGSSEKLRRAGSHLLLDGEGQQGRQLQRAPAVLADVEITAFQRHGRCGNLRLRRMHWNFGNDEFGLSAAATPTKHEPEADGGGTSGRICDGVFINCGWCAPATRLGALVA